MAIVDIRAIRDISKLADPYKFQAQWLGYKA